MKSHSARSHPPEAARSALFVKCKWWLGVALGFKAIVFVSGALTVLLPIGSGFAPTVIGGLAAISELAMWRSDWIKGIAETLHRKLEWEHSFGWQITNTELRDLLARIDVDVSELVDEADAKYIASQEPPSDRRALEKLEEVAWWSKHLAESMWKICLGAICALVFGCLLLLLTSIQAISDQAALSNVGVIVTPALLLIFSLSLLRFTVGYFTFSKSAEKTEERAKLLGTTSAQPAEIVKLWQEYQLARALAPLLPTRIWKLREKRLNALWRAYRN